MKTFKQYLLEILESDEPTNGPEPIIPDELELSRRQAARKARDDVHRAKHEKKLEQDREDLERLAEVFHEQTNPDVAYNSDDPKPRLKILAVHKYLTDSTLFRTPDSRTPESRVSEIEKENKKALINKAAKRFHFIDNNFDETRQGNETEKFDELPIAERQKHISHATAAYNLMSNYLRDGVVESPEVIDDIEIDDPDSIDIDDLDFTDEDDPESGYSRGEKSDDTSFEDWLRSQKPPSE